MQNCIDEACETVQAAAAGKSRAEIRRMLAAEFRSRDVPPLPPELFEVAVNQIAAGTYAPGEPLVSVLPATVRVVPDRSDDLRAGTASPGG